MKKKQSKQCAALLQVMKINENRRYKTSIEKTDFLSFINELREELRQNQITTNAIYENLDRGLWNAKHIDLLFHCRQVMRLDIISLKHSQRMVSQDISSKKKIICKLKDQERMLDKKQESLKFIYKSLIKAKK